MPAEVIRDIDRHERNRSRFILEAVRRELERRRIEELQRSLAQPHPETADFVAEGFDQWADGLPDEDPDGLVDPEAGTPVRWIPETGWVEEDR